MAALSCTALMICFSVNQGTEIAAVMSAKGTGSEGFRPAQSAEGSETLSRYIILAVEPS